MSSMIKILNDTAQKSLGIVKNSSLVKSWWKNQLTKVYKEYKDTRKAFTYRAIPASHKKLKSTKELTDNAKKHEKAFNFYRSRRQAVLENVRESYRKKKTITM